jgi:hypothetical protein
MSQVGGTSSEFGVYEAFGYQQDTHNKPSRPLRSFAIHLGAAYSNLMRIAATPPNDNSINTCRQECVANSPYCLRLSIGGNVQQGLSWIHKIGLSSPPVVKKSDMLEQFGQSSDGCNRGDTTISNGMVENIGSDGVCNMTTNLSVSDVTIAMPAKLRGKYEIKESIIESVFDDPSTRANVRFSDDALQKLWGGDIVAVSSETEYMAFSVGAKSCIRLKIN